ncbi:hypothetical protein EJB05_49558, partial [Eragrostis curvula]
MAHRPAAPAALPDNDDLLCEFLLCLPPQPSSLPRASLVCKRWRRLVTDPGFRIRFRARHRKPPLIGVFEDQFGYHFFRSVMDPPDLIPAERFLPPLGDDDTDGLEVLDQWRIFGCRHGCVLLFNRKRNEIVLWDPLTGDFRAVAVPLEFVDEAKIIWNGAVICTAAGDRGHVHGGFSSCPFKVVLVGITSNNTQIFAGSYSWETGQWNDIVSTDVPFLHGGVLKFDLDRHILGVIEWPPSADDPGNCRLIFQTEDCCLGFAILGAQSLQMWERKLCSEGVANWVLRKTEKLYKVLGMQSETEVRAPAMILGYSEDANVSRVHLLLRFRDGSLVQTCPRIRYLVEKLKPEENAKGRVFQRPDKDGERVTGCPLPNPAEVSHHHM